MNAEDALRGLLHDLAERRDALGRKIDRLPISERSERLLGRDEGLSDAETLVERALGALRSGS